MRGNIRVAPTAVYLSDKSRSGEITISSTSKSPVDVRLDLYFGYVMTDTLGKPQVFFDESDASNRKSCASWISINPKRFTLLPGETRTVRFIARPPSGLEDGEYWSRLSILAETGKELADGGSSKLDASQQINVRTFVPISYRKGECFADIKLTNVVISRTAELVSFDALMAPLGNSAYIGNMSVTVRNASKKTLFSTRHELAVFIESKRRYGLPAKDMPPGKYTAIIVFDTDRPDLGEHALQVLPKTFTVEFQLH